jgi:hypothetical protein
MNQPKQKVVSLTREQLGVAYAEVLAQNPLLARTEGQCRSIGWTDEEIRTMQLLLACKSNASLMDRVRELELLLTEKA